MLEDLALAAIAGIVFLAAVTWLCLVQRRLRKPRPLTAEEKERALEEELRAVDKEIEGLK